MKKPKLYPLDLFSLRQDEAAAFVLRFETDYTALSLDSTSEADFNLLLQKMLDQLPTYILAVNQIQAEAESKAIAALDKARDIKIGTFRKALRVFEKTDEAPEKIGYNLLKLVSNNNRNVAKENFETESLNLTKFIGDLRNPTNLPALKLLALENHVNKMETANESFKSKFSTRSNTVNITVVYDAKKLNRAILNDYKKLANYIFTMVSIKDVPFYNALFDMNNNILQYYATIIARRGNDDSDETPPPAGG
jgi:Family of unknown function (DUF6261)